MRMIESPAKFLQQLFDEAVRAASPTEVLAANLPQPPAGRTVVVGAGKAAAAMAKAVEEAWAGELDGLVVTRYGHGLPLRRIEVVEASHPVPDRAGQEVSQRLLDRVDGLGAEDLVLCLISGGASSLLPLPPPGISLQEKQEINRQLLKSGADIEEMNCVRKHLSLIKGGRLAQHCRPAKLVTLAISDVPGDVPEIIGSGPTVYDSTTSAQALEILARYQIQTKDAVRNWLSGAESETLKPDSGLLDGCEYRLIATPQQSLTAAVRFCENLGVACLVLSDSIEGESREVAKVHAAIARQVKKFGQPLAAPCVILSGGETTVTVRGSGRGGRNAEFMLSLLNELKGEAGIYALAADTDGIDGTEDNAGCLLSPESFSRARAMGINLELMLENNDGYGVFSQLEDLLITGPTRTNVNDFRAILICADSRSGID